MNASILFNSELVENLGWTLFHSLWQIASVAVVLFVLLKAFRAFSANARYLLAVCALIFAAAIPVLTFYQLNKSRNPAFPASGFSKKENPQISEKAFFSPEDSAAQIENRTNLQSAQPAGIFASISKLQSDFSKTLTVGLPFVVAFWLFGIALFGLRLIGGFWQMRVLKTRGVAAPDEKWRNAFSRLCERLSIRRNVRLLQSAFVETPVVIGWLKPVILIPASVFLSINPKELETIIAHELVHIRRCDALVNFAQSFVEVLFFYHPCVWWISAVIRSEREFAADESVVRILENSRIVYASALANLEELRHLTNQNLTPLITAASGGNLVQRISKILQKNTEIKAGTVSLWSAVAAFAVISAFLLSVFSFNDSAVVNAGSNMKNKKIAVGFVSIPTNRISSADKSLDETPRLLIEKLNEHKIPAIGFVNGAMVSGGEKTGSETTTAADVIRLWRDAGLEVGIGNYRHVWFYDTPFDAYVAGAEKSAEITRKILDEKNIPLEYFSYPYLNTGKTVEDHRRFEAWLAQKNLSSVKYTIDNQEWMYSWAYDAAREAGDSGKMIEIRADFLKYMSEMFDHYETYSREMFGRDINQTMVLTPSRLVADTSDELFGMIEKRGYEFVSIKEALADEAYRTPENFAGVKAGISWFERWQMAQNKDLLKEPEVSETVSRAWQNRKSGTQQKDVPPPPPPPPAPRAPIAPPAPPAPTKSANQAKPEAPPAAPKPPKPPRAPRAPKSSF